MAKLARSLVDLRRQVDDAAPGRSRVSDGWIGDTAHSKRKSDHNPDGYGIVRALDITHDPVNGVDGSKLAAAVVASRDPRLKYIIWNRRIISGSKGPSAWVWRPYSGANPHDKHIHFSVLGGDPNGVGNRAGDWALGELSPGDPLPADPADGRPLVKRGSTGQNVALLQRALAKWGSDLKPDGIFGKRTEAAVKAFQKAKGLVVDGKVGPYTWRALLA